MTGINIFSGSTDPLGAALTNPTELARKKGGLTHRYPLRFGGRQWPDVEAAYLALKGTDFGDNDRLMVEMIAAKLTQHPALLSDITARGGRAFLEACSHWTGARTAHFQSWEGDGVQSRFIRNLLCAFDQVCSASLAENGQLTLAF